LLAVPSAGTLSSPAASAVPTAWKNAAPLQNDTCPKIDPFRPSTQLPCCMAVGVAPTWVKLVPLNPTSIVTTAFAGSVGTTGGAAGVVPCVITSGEYTASAPVAGSRIVACTKAPRFAELAVVQPDAAGVIPPGPVNCHGVASPAALSGSAGTIMSQLTFAAATGAVAVALGVALGHGVATAVAVGVADAVAVADAVVVAVVDTVGVGVGCVQCLLWCLLWCNGSLVADTACVVPAAEVEDDVADATADGVAGAVVDDVADTAAEGVAGAVVDDVGDAAEGVAGAVVDDVADAAAEGVAQAPCAERLRLPGPPISFRPRINPTTSARATGTATLAARAL
jgi:hypothetical protein